LQSPDESAELSLWERFPAERDEYTRITNAIAQRAQAKGQSCPMRCPDCGAFRPNHDIDELLPFARHAELTRLIAILEIVAGEGDAAEESGHCQTVDSRL
jgi:hypothetical protein